MPIKLEALEPIKAMMIKNINAIYRPYLEEDIPTPTLELLADKFIKELGVEDELEVIEDYAKDTSSKMIHGENSKMYAIFNDFEFVHSIDQEIHNSADEMSIAVTQTLFINKIRIEYISLSANAKLMDSIIKHDGRIHYAGGNSIGVGIAELNKIN